MGTAQGSVWFPATAPAHAPPHIRGQCWPLQLWCSSLEDEDCCCGRESSSGDGAGFDPALHLKAVRVAIAGTGEAGGWKTVSSSDGYAETVPEGSLTHTGCVLQLHFLQDYSPIGQMWLCWEKGHHTFRRNQTSSETTSGLLL